MILKPFKSKNAVIGMVHLPSLPGSPYWSGSSGLDNLIYHVRQDVNSLVKGGVDGLLFENFGDSPFIKSRVAPLITSTMTKIINNCTDNLTIPFGVNVLRNDWESALSIAAITGGEFIRINILTGAYATDQGIIEGEGYDCLKFRKHLEHEFGRTIRIFADVNTKHGTPLHIQKIEETTLDLVERTKPEAIILTGSRTGAQADINELKSVRKLSVGIPVLIGSGVNDKNINEYSKYADGFIIGSYFKIDGKTTNRVDINRVKKLMGQLQ
jgi:membrane complex biogenesis BtpA family protein